MLMQRKSGEDYVKCDQGHWHWGTNGAAGMLLRHKDPNGLTRYFLQQRGPDVQNPGTWSTPGGAIEDGETPHAAAIRESQEELGNFPLTNLTHLHTLDHGGWAYHTMVGDVPHPFYPQNSDPNEHSDSGWFTPTEVDELPLHPGFREGWDQYKPNRRPDPKSVWSKVADYYHTAPTEDRARIQQYGLQPSRPFLNPRWKEHDTIKGQQPGVYAIGWDPELWGEPTPEDIRYELWNDAQQHPEKYDVWHVPQYEFQGQEHQDWRGGDQSVRLTPTAPIYPNLWLKGPEEYGPWPERQSQFTPQLPEQDGSTEPQEVNNPEDHWPDWGEAAPKPNGTHTDWDWALTRV